MRNEDLVNGSQGLVNDLVNDVPDMNVGDTVNRKDLITSFKLDDDGTAWDMKDIIYRIEQFPSAEKRANKRTETHECDLPSAEPECKKNTVQKFHDYQVEWLKSHYDIELDTQLEKMIVRFLHDTANCYMMEVEHD